MNKNISFVNSKDLSLEIKFKNKFVNINDNKKLPITPEYVFLGLILVSFGPLKNLPNTKKEIFEYNNKHDPHGQSTEKDIIFILSPNF